jgi:hypothetical protein
MRARGEPAEGAHRLFEPRAEVIDRGHPCDRPGAEVVGPDQDRDVGDVLLGDVAHLSFQIDHLRAALRVVEVPLEDRRLGVKDAHVVALHRAPRARRPGVPRCVGEQSARVERPGDGIAERGHGVRIPSQVRWLTDEATEGKEAGHDAP